MDNINANISFTARPKVKKIIPKAAKKFKSFCAGVESPSYMCYFTPADELSRTALKDANLRLGVSRTFRKNLLGEGGLPEFSELMKIILRMNKVKRCDMFALYSQKANETPKALDHCVVALNVPKARNNKKNRVPFVPKDNVKIIDMWWPNGFVGNVKKAKELYKIFGLQKDEKLLVKPQPTLEPDKKCFDRILKDFPQLKIN